jgi:hypothetical protein
MQRLHYTLTQSESLKIFLELKDKVQGGYLLFRRRNDEKVNRKINFYNTTKREFFKIYYITKDHCCTWNNCRGIF